MIEAADIRQSETPASSEAKGCSLQQLVLRPYYQDASVTIYHGDCREILEHAPTIDLVLTDPPYGMAYNSGWTKVSNAIRSDGVRQGVRLLRAALFEMLPRLAPDAHLYTFCHWESWPDFYDAASTYFNLRNALIWWKDRGGMGDLRHEYGKDYEVILFGARGRRELTGSRDGCVIEGIAPCPPNNRNHPTEKPDALMRYLIEKSCPPGGMVCDPFMGAGATLVAAKSVGRRAIGVELEEKYCEIAARRCSQEMAMTQAENSVIGTNPPAKG